jgi:hypothetical protein
VAAGRHVLRLQVTSRPDLTGSVTFGVDAETWVGGELDRLLKRVPIGCGRTYLGYAPVTTVSGAVQVPARLTGTIHSVTAVTGDRAAQDGGGDEAPGAVPTLQEEDEAEMREQ